MARPKLGETDTERMQLKITAAEIDAIDDWRFANRIPSRSEAVRRLCQIGLQMESMMENAGDYPDRFMQGAIDLFGQLEPSDESLSTQWIEQNFPELARQALKAMLMREVLLRMRQGDTVEDALAAAEKSTKEYKSLIEELNEGEDL